ncbi:MAG: DUF1049 domain-containing protein [Gammaproteobacteria bacterium]|nr:DUF1049 domain-containing protein [Gammaproteobacteria bacterium]
MKYKFAVTILLLLLVMIFAVQNAETVEVQLLFWAVNLPRSLLIFMMLLIGTVIGWFLRSILRISRNNQ